MTSDENLSLPEGMENPGDDKYVVKYQGFLSFSFLILFKGHMAVYRKNYIILWHTSYMHIYYTQKIHTNNGGKINYTITRFLYFM